VKLVRREGSVKGSYTLGDLKKIEALVIVKDGTAP